MQKIEEVVSLITETDSDLMDKAQSRLDNLTKPTGSLGRLEELARQVVGITRREQPLAEKKAIVTMAGDHGVTEEGVSAYPREVTPQMVENFLRGGAGINVLARHVGAKVLVVDMGVAAQIEPHPDLVVKKVAPGTRNIMKGPAMTREEAVRSIEAGIEVVDGLVAEGLDIVGTGDMGIGNTTPSSAIVAALTGEAVEKVTGKGTGIDDATFARKVKVIEQALRVNGPDPDDPIDVLTKVGGFEIGGLAGVIVRAASLKIPVVIDGFISGAAALVAAGLEPKTTGYMIAAHCSVERGHRVVLQKLGLTPILDLDLRLGEGTGAALGISIVEASIKILNEMATFQDAGVSERTR